MRSLYVHSKDYFKCTAIFPTLRYVVTSEYFGDKFLFDFELPIFFQQNFSSSYIQAHNNEAKEAVLENLPRIFAAISSLWQSITPLKSGFV